MKTLITNIGQLVTPLPTRSAPRATVLLDVREHTEILIEDERIVAVGASERRAHVDARIDAEGGVVLPALVDPHTHFAPASDPDIAEPVSAAPVERRLRRALIDGVTTVEVKCRGLAELGELATLARSDTSRLPTIVATLYGAPPPGGTHARWMGALIGDAIPAVRRRRLARFCDVECGEEAYSPEEARTILRAARAAGLQLELHATGGSAGAVGALAAELGITAVGHVTQLDPRDAKQWRSIGVTPVLLPGDVFIDGRTPPDAGAMLAAGLAVGLGTNAGARPIAAGSMWMILALGVTILGMSLDQAIAAVTLHNAHALDLAAEIGSLEPGKRADLVILDVLDYRDLLAGLGENPVVSVVRGGQVVHRR